MLAGAEIASSAEFNSLNQGGKWQNRGRNLNRGRNNYHGISQLPVGIPIGTIIMIKSTIRSTFVE